jgi:outer membrane protein assembly factor BamB
MKSLLSIVGFLSVFSCVAQETSESFMKGRRFVAGDYSGSKVAIVEADGTVSWSFPAPICNDVWILPGDLLLFVAGKAVREVSIADKKIKFEYTSQSDIFGTQRLANGNTFVAECNGAQLLEVAPDGKVVKRVKLNPGEKEKGHGYMRNARVLPNGHYLASHYAGRRVAEYDAEGKEVWTGKLPTGVHSAVRLPNGNTMVAGADNGPTGLREFNPAGEVVWSLTNDDLADKPLKFMTGFQVLPNGNILLSNWLGHGHLGKAPHLMEVTRDKRVVWIFNDHVNFKTIASVQVFPKEGEKLEIMNLH